MRPVVVAAVLLLVVLVSVPASVARTLQQFCDAKYPVTNCRKDLHGGGWFQFGHNRCVKAFFHTRRLNHIEAKKVCQRNPNGDLVSIHSHAEKHKLACAMYRASTRRFPYWIGLIRGKDGFKWTDGSKMDFTRWARGQPNNLRHDCTSVNFKRWGLWNDEYCGRRRTYVCAVSI